MAADAVDMEEEEEEEEEGEEDAVMGKAAGVVPKTHDELLAAASALPELERAKLEWTGLVPATSTDSKTAS